jgi:hypothetical protein
MVRIETFIATDPEQAGGPRGFLASLQVVEIDPKTKRRVVSASMNFYGASEAHARAQAEQWLANERVRQDRIEGNREAASERMKARRKEPA